MKTHAFVADYVSASIIEKGYAIVDDLLLAEAFDQINQRFDELQDEHEFEKAGIGKLLHFTIDEQVRGDYIRWIDSNDKEAPVYPLYEYISTLIQYLNRTCFLSIKDLESHYAYYPKGKGYLKHRDRFKNNPHRIVSFVYYLNENWQKEDGGELVLYDEDEQQIDVVAPVANRLVVFLSETIHEVLNSNTGRKSITGWLLDVPANVTFLD